ncbi:hypothetical protein AAZX31_17G014300 [Glycine max]|uniref:AT hook motif-containing protein n=2 Tax=Glycine subgen. Soja TaxID=1462606 RepID=K7MJG0_SOYBN|nr:uncharacterized protein LOC100817103 [Glycine max]XP_028208934.1 uncharacterized protein LOC114392097 [Glycine soja]KAG4378293.1 hypothetical protein GLYMA_17G014700v4 [Glycine max]KAG4378294.1 hypothetical protein GLYMA_17G014700v4 [Glycine max]KAG4929227.1 hypothetical protein JHK86_046188 [Glycine max]KAG4931962.1 hypothetical protein JHK87_045964 [Glycine soja]KAG4942087.1 hypothetical protein JHK85_046733 [Glycine max]|eukprot:XP_003550498.2 uncharacterized protein LOC100817103 [Glycine max]
MNQQNQGSGPPLNVPMKRKRGRPRKEESVVQGANVPVMPGSNNVLNSNQTAGTTTVCDDEMVGKVVTGVIDGTFNAGYLLSVKVADTDAFLRGLVFVEDQVSPVNVENDVAPHVKMIERKEIPIPVVNPQAEIHGSVPSSVQCNKQSFEPELQQVPMSEEQVLPTEIHSGISGLLENQSSSTLIPNSISSEGIPQGIQEPGHVNQSTSILSELDHDKTVKQGETLHELDASTQVKESSADGGETKVSEAVSELINLVPPIENTNMELGTGQQTLPYVQQLNEPNISNIEFNLIPVSAEPEALSCEQTTKTVNYFVEKQELPKTDVLEDTKTKLAIETSSNVDTSNSNGKPSTDVVSIPVVGSNHRLDTSQPESMPSEQVGKSVPSESKFSSEGHDLWGKRDPQNCSSFGDINKVDFNQPTESLAKSIESEKQIGSDT